MIILAYILFLFAVLFFIGGIAAKDEGTIGCWVAAGFIGFLSLQLPNSSSTTTRIEKEITVEVTPSHVYIYKKGEQHKGAWFESDKAIDVNNYKKIVGIECQNTYGIFGVQNGTDVNKKIIFSEEVAK